MAFLFCILLTLTKAFASTDAVLQTIEPQTTSAGFATVLTFDRDFSPQVMIDYQNEYIQVDLKGQATVPRREVVRVADREIQSVILSQFAPDVVRARLVMREKGDPARFKGRIKAESDGAVVRVALTSVADAAAETAAAESSEPVVSQDEPKVSGVVTAEELLATEMERQIPAKEDLGFVETAENSAVPEKAEAATPLKSEAEIPVLNKVTKTAEKTADPVTRLLLSLGIVAILAIGILAFGRFYSKRKSGFSQHHQIKVLTQYGLGPKKSLAIIRVAGESILIGITDQNISMIKSLALMDEDLPMEMPGRFESALEDMVKKEDAEDFSFGGVKDMVAGRLREMRSL